MAPGTNLGAATPIQLGGGSQPLGENDNSDNKADEDRQTADAAPMDAHTAKAVNDAVASIRSLAELHRRNADWAEKAVRQAASLSAKAALDQNVIELMATDLPDLLAKAEGRSVQLQNETVGGGPNSVPADRLTFVGNFGNGLIVLTSTARLIEPDESFVGRFGHSVVIEASPSCCDADLVLIRMLAKAANTRPVIVQRADPLPPASSEQEEGKPGRRA